MADPVERFREFQIEDTQRVLCLLGVRYRVPNRCYRIRNTPRYIPPYDVDVVAPPVLAADDLQLFALEFYNLC